MRCQLRTDGCELPRSLASIPTHNLLIRIEWSGRPQFPKSLVGGSTLPGVSTNLERMMPSTGPVYKATPGRSRPLPAIVVGGLAVGVLDLAYAILVYSPKKPIRVPQAIASGLLGASSFQGGWQTAILGVFLHFVIALGAATVFYWASRRMRLILERPVLYGMLYGALVYAFMHLIVLPFSNIAHGPTRWAYQIPEFIWHWIGVGLPISFSVRRYSH